MVGFIYLGLMYSSAYPSTSPCSFPQCYMQNGSQEDFEVAEASSLYANQRITAKGRQNKATCDVTSDVQNVDSDANPR